MTELATVDSVEILVLVDNATDTLSTVPLSLIHISEPTRPY